MKKLKCRKTWSTGRKTTLNDFLRKSVYGPTRSERFQGQLNGHKVQNLPKCKCLYLDQEVTKFIGCCSVLQVLVHTKNRHRETRLDSNFVLMFHVNEVHVDFAKICTTSNMQNRRTKILSSPVSLCRFLVWTSTEFTVQQLINLVTY